MIELTSKVSNLYKLNQDIKKTGEKYCLFPNDIIVFSDDSTKVKKGEHFGLIKDNNLEIMKEDMYIKFLGKSIFETFKENKKEIKNISEDNSLLFITKGNENILIGKFVPIEFIDEIMNYSYNKAKVLIKEDKDKITLSEDNIKSLEENDLICFSDGKHKIRVCKELIPGLNKKFTTRLYFKEIANEKVIFETIIEVDRELMTTYHVYKCINL
jgi:hypothetical protein